MSACRCDSPRLNDRRPGYCRKCGVRLDPRWMASDETITEFCQRIENLPGVEAPLLLHARARELERRNETGTNYLTGGNRAKGRETAADGVVNCAHSWLRDRRVGIEDDPSLIEAAYHFARAYAALMRRS